ncbi:hypothetical protein OG235_01100 [Streptomyces sp. NBC_00024]|uniref:hypothetical protein n=1 Tax=Streptomyces sp. NBC_00024 TaxID=2903612 RepID=UPI00324A652B
MSRRWRGISTADAFILSGSALVREALSPPAASVQSRPVNRWCAKNGAEPADTDTDTRAGLSAAGGWCS